MLLFGGVADDDALETSTFFNDVCAALLPAHICHTFPLSFCSRDTLCMYVLKLERMQWHQVIPYFERASKTKL